jgi:hypothetical protein
LAGATDFHRIAMAVDGSGNGTFLLEDGGSGASSVGNLTIENVERGNGIKCFGSTSRLDIQVNSIVQISCRGFEARFYSNIAASLTAFWDIGTDVARFKSTYLSDILNIKSAVASNALVKLDSGELTPVATDIAGKISFGFPDATAGTDAILDGAAIWAEANDTFAADNNTTDLVFATAASEVAAEKMRLTSAGALIMAPGGHAEIDRTTEDAPFLNLKATADADATSAISTLTTSGSVTNHIQIEINGTTAWIPVSTTDPT